MSEHLVDNLLLSVAKNALERFKQSNSLMSFAQYLQLVTQNPQAHLRNSAQYFSDAIDHFGAYALQNPLGEFSRYRLFDAEFDHYEGKVMGQESVQEEVVRHIKNFVRAGKVDRLILLHGPNGSAKSSMVNALARAAEIYSKSEEGAIYKFSWIFPLKKTTSGSMGFAGSHAEEMHSFAGLPVEEIEACIPCEHKDHPLVLLPLDFRGILFKQMIEEGSIGEQFPLPDMLRKGELSAKNNKIFQALLTSYHGDIKKVLRHVQVERFYLSKRFRTGLAAVEPQMSVDAHARQLVGSAGLLPAVLAHLSLIELGGPLIDANRGMLEYSDLLKRPIESWKYLLVATEAAQASLDMVTVFFDMLMLASSNESHLDAFKAYPDWQSFKGRIELVRVPYLLRYSDELQIYQNQIPRALVGTHISPHALEIASRWAVLTRLEPPKPEEYEPAVGDIVRTITPYEKMRLYDSAATPERLSRQESQRLLSSLSHMRSEYRNEHAYEGLHGASPREIIKLLLSAAQNKNYDHLSVFAVFDELKLLIKDKSSYAFLSRESIRSFRDAAGLLEQVETHFKKQLNEEVQSAIGLVQAHAHRELFERYVKHVSAWTKNEKILDAGHKEYMQPDVELMAQVEKTLMATHESAKDFRQSLISQIGAYRLDNPDSNEVDYAAIFPTFLKRLQDEYYGTQSKIVERVLRAYLDIIQGNDGEVNEKDREQVRLFQKNMSALGFNDSSMRQAVAYILKPKS